MNLRTDCGTENVLIAAIQHLTGGRHKYGTSPGNQRIEAWWSFYRRHHSQWWLDVFEALVASNHFHPGNMVETDCLRFCFMNVIQRQLDDVRRQWNTHRIRPSTGAACPAGVPDELYYLTSPPATNLLRTGTACLPDEVQQQAEQPRVCADANFEEYLHYLCAFHQLPAPYDAESATRLYRSLLGNIN